MNDKHNDVSFDSVLNDAKAAKSAKAVKALAVSSVVSSFVVPFSGIVLGAVALRKGKKSGAVGYKHWAWWGIFLSSLPILIAVALVPFMADCMLSLGADGGMCFGVEITPEMLGR